jgi:hypothetical protein
MGINNNRSDNDFAILDDSLYSGIEKNNAYPKKIEKIYEQYTGYNVKGDMLNCFFISGGENEFFKATNI